MKPRIRRAILSLFLALSFTAHPAWSQARAPAGVEPKTKKKGEDAAENVNAPRRDARRVSFEVSEGTWMNLDVSPDGRMIAFDLLGDIYLVPLEGGEARAITRGPAWDFHPRFSPDGSRIAFSSDRGGMTNVWLMDADGARPRAVTSDEDHYIRSPAWSPDGDYLIARRETGVRGGIPPVELWMWHVEGGDGIQVTKKEKHHDATGAAFSADGRFLYLAAREGSFSYEPDLGDGLWQVHRLDRRNGEMLQLTQGFGGAARPVPSPDGRTLLFVSRRDADTVLVERDLGSGSERILARGLSRDEQEGFAENDLYPSYAFVPDGGSVILWSRGKLVRLDLATREQREIPFRAESVHWLAPRVVLPERLSDGPVTSRIVRWAGESADASLVAFDAFGRIWLQALKDGMADGAPWRLTRDGEGPSREFAPAFSPDGRWIAYVTWSDEEGGHVVRARVPEGRAPAPPPLRLTTRAGHYANPAWSTRGDKVAFVRGSGLEFRGRQPEEETWFEAAWIPAEGGEPRYVASLQLADSLRFHPQVFFSPDGERLSFRERVEPEEPDGDESARLVSVRLDGTDKKAHLGLPVLGEAVPSPDGRWLAFTSRDNVYLAPIPPITLEEPPSLSLDEGAVPVFRLSAESGSFVRWSRGGAALTWTHGSRFHRVELAEVLAFAQRQRAKLESDDSESEDSEDLELPESESFDLSVSLPRPQPAGSLLLGGGRVITQRGDEVLERADVLITGSRIAAVGPQGTLAVPEGARVVDVGGKTIIPGLIDTHAHLHYSAYEIFPETKWEHAANLAYGVTTVFDPSAPSLDTFAQAEMIEAGLMTGPRVTSSGDVLFGGRQTDIWAQVDSLEDALRQVRRMKARGARMIKVYQQGRRSARLWFVEACRREKMLLTAEGAGEMMTDLTMALDGYTALEHSLPVEIFDDVVQLMALSGMHYTPTLLVAYGGPAGETWFWQHESPHDDPKLNRFTPHLALDRFGRRRQWIHPEDYHFPQAAAGVARVLRAGGNVSLGAHGQLQGLGVLWEIRAMAGEGAIRRERGEFLSPHEALRASTLLAADKIGLAQDLGSIEPGKKADLVVLDANPLDSLQALEKARWVMKDGVLWNAATLRQEWPEAKDLPPFFWSGKDR